MTTFFFCVNENVFDRNVYTLEKHKQRIMLQNLVPQTTTVERNLNCSNQRMIQNLIYQTLIQVRYYFV